MCNNNSLRYNTVHLKYILGNILAELKSKPFSERAKYVFLCWEL